MSEETNTPQADPKELREAFERQKAETEQLRKSLFEAKLGSSVTDTQRTALDAVLGGDWSDPDKAVNTYRELFGAAAPSSNQNDSQPTTGDVSGQEISEAPAPPPGSDLIDNVSGMTAGAGSPPGEPAEEDPVEAGFRAYRDDLNRGRRRDDAAAQVINRLVDRGVKNKPGGVYDHDAYQQALAEGTAYQPVEVREVGFG